MEPRGRRSGHRSHAPPRTGLNGSSAPVPLAVVTRPHRLGLATLVFALAAAACSGGGESGETTAAPTPTSATPGPTDTTQAPATTVTTASGSSTTTSTTLDPRTTSPLNGLEVLAPERLSRRAIAVQIDNHPAAHPQSGLQDAEAVFEIRVGGGLTRLIAVFHAVDSEYVGPIRSLRPTDATVVRPLGAPMQVSGGQDWIRRDATDRGVNLLGEDRGGTTFRIGERQAPHNLYGSTLEMRAASDGRGLSNDPPPPMFAYGVPSPTTGPATTVSFDWASRYTVVWEWDGRRYLRSSGSGTDMWVDEAGNVGSVAFDTLLVIHAERFSAQPPPGTQGANAPAFATVGSGRATAFYAGRVVEGVWARDSIEEPFTLTIAAETMTLPPGRIWISVFPSDRQVSWE